MKSETIVATLLISLSLLFMILYAYTATQRVLSEIEAIIFQIFAIFAGIGGSYFLGRRISRENFKEMIEPHARSAFRRLMSLYSSLSRVAKIIESEELRDDETKIVAIQAIVQQQIETADDALADWQEIVPKIVEETKKGIVERWELQQREKHNND